MAPKRRQMKRLDCDLLLVRDQGVGGSNPLSPTISFNQLQSHAVGNLVSAQGT